MPAPAQAWLEVQGAELVEAEHAAALGRMGVEVEHPVLLGLEVGVGRGLPGLVVHEADAMVTEDAPQLAGADGRHDLRGEEVGAQLRQAPGTEGLTGLGRAGEGHLHDRRALRLIDPDRSAPALARVQRREAPLVEGVDELRHVRRAGAVQQRDPRDALALERGEEEHRAVLGHGAPAAAGELEEVGRLPVAQLAHEQLGPAGHLHLLATTGRRSAPGTVRLPTGHYELGQTERLEGDGIAEHPDELATLAAVDEAHDLPPAARSRTIRASRGPARHEPRGRRCPRDPARTSRS